MTQEQLANRLDVSPQAVREWEAGTKLPMLERVPEIAQFLRVDPGLFFPTAPDVWASEPGDVRDPSIESRLTRIELQLELMLQEIRRLEGGPLAAPRPSGRYRA